tara:strand:- start:449 stop:673 length:225 start_codon:yes stop_codon:yes gene_type:complete
MKKTIHNVLTGEIQTIDMTSEEEQNAVARQEITESNIEANKVKAEEHTALKASAKAKLIAGEPLTEDEADTIVL